MQKGSLMRRIPWWSFSVLASLSVLAPRALADTVVQIPVDTVLNARSVTTLTAGKLVTWQMGIDGGGKGNGYLTMAASLFVGDKNPHALPDSALIAADARHPALQLHWSNGDGTSNQTRAVTGAGAFTLPVPAAAYSKLFLCFTSAEGASALTFKLDYGDSVQTINLTLPDYYNDIAANDPALFYVVKDLAKWNNANRMSEASHHNIDGVELHPAAGKTLRSVRISKTAGGYLVFWGATGIATGSVTGLLPLSARAGARNRSRLWIAGDLPGPGRVDAAGRSRLP
jgi:hypothetical protein